MTKDQKQAQVLAALDKIAQKLSDMEKDRNALRSELVSVKSGTSEFEELLLKKTDTRINAYKGEQKAFRKALEEFTKDQAELKQKITEVDAHRAVVANVTNENLKKALDESLKIQRQIRQEMEMNSVRQARLEEELIHSQQRQNAMLRKIEAISTRHQRLSKKVDQVEQNAIEAQETFQERTKLLLNGIRTETSDASDDIRYETRKQKGFPKIAGLTNADEQDNTLAEKAVRLGTTASMIALIVGLIGFGVWRTSYYQDTAQTPKEIVAQQLEKSENFAQVEQKKSLLPDLFSGSNTKGEETSISSDETGLQPVEIVDAENAFEDVAVYEGDATQEIETQEAVSKAVDAETSVDVAESGNADVIAAEEQTVSASILPTPDSDVPEEYRALEKLAFEGKGDAQHDLAALYSSGEHGFKQNFKKAAYWFKESAENGVANARYNLGVLYHQGLGVKQDVDKAIYWYGRAAELGHPEAQYNLGIANIEGIGTSYNPKLAVAYFRQAATGNVPEAAYNLGLILENGLLGEANYEEALYWYAKAGDMGNKSAKSALTSLMGVAKLGASDVNEIRAVYDAAYFNGNFDNIDTASGSPASKGYIANKEDLIEQVSLPAMSDWQKTVAEVQNQLKILDLYDGPRDGIYGPHTRDAIKVYEGNYGLPVTGEPSRELLAHMLDVTQPLHQGSSE